MESLGNGSFGKCSFDEVIKNIEIKYSNILFVVFEIIYQV